jgi:UMF1 family MFS transporter
MSLLETLGLNRRELRAWALYDVANSAFATTIMVAILPVYFQQQIASDLPAHMRSAYWAYFNAATMIAVALLSPAFGYFADVGGTKKKSLAFFTVVGALASMALALVGQGDWILTGVIYIIANFSFHAGIVFYESLLPHIANEKEVHRVSTSAYALGYLGGGILLAINLAWVTQPQLFGLPDASVGVKLSFVSVGIIWLLFMVPLLRQVPEPLAQKQDVIRAPIQASFTALLQVKRTFSKLRRYPQAMTFLLAFWLYSDAVGTIINMATIYGLEVGISSDDLVLAILLVQFIGVPASFAFGPITHAIGPKKALFITLLIYLGVTSFAYFMSTAWHFWVLAVGVALVQGANQAISRSIFAQMVPLQHSGEFFGLFSVMSKFAGLFGPLVFGLLSSNLGESRYSILFLVFLFVAGMVLLSKVDIEKGKQEAEVV